MYDYEHFLWELANKINPSFFKKKTDGVPKIFKMHLNAPQLVKALQQPSPDFSSCYLEEPPAFQDQFGGCCHKGD